MIDHALALAAEGYPVHPVRGKVPTTSHGCLDATTDPAQICAWEWPGIGIATGRPMRGGYLVVVDVDVDIAADKRGDVTLAERIRDDGPMPWTRQVLTGGGGSHFYFVSPEPISNGRGRVGRWIDVRGTGGYVVAPPSPHASKHRYAWFDDGAPLATLSGWLLEAVRAPRPANDAPIMPVAGRWGHDFGSRVARAFSYVDKMPEAISGAGGHDALWRVALAVVRGFELDAAPAIEVLRYYNLRCSPPWSERELAHKLQQAQTAKVPQAYLERRSA